jgi:hypothetical protein
MFWSLSAPALACGGFFCGAPAQVPDPVVQTEERILFEVEPTTGEVTAYIEIQYEGEPTDFAWLLPVAGPIDPESGIDTAPPGLFDNLELVTAPVFRQVDTMGGVAACAGPVCCGPAPSEGFSGSTFGDTSGVGVVGEAVVGPYAIEILTATEGDNLVNWLQMNGYAFPDAAAEPLQFYIDQQMQFVAVKLLPTEDEGPIDTLVVACAAGTPTIPLLLTAISSAPELEITAYVLADEPYRPENYEDLAFDYRRVQVVDGESDYEELLEEAVEEAGGQAWNTEFAGSVSAVMSAMPLPTQQVLSGGTYLSRFHTFVAPQDMTLDPSFAPAPDAPDVDNQHIVGGYRPGTDTGSTSSASVWIWGVVALGLSRRRAGATPESNVDGPN